MCGLFLWLEMLRAHGQTGRAVLKAIFYPRPPLLDLPQNISIATMCLFSEPPPPRGGGQTRVDEGSACTGRLRYESGRDGAVDIIEWCCGAQVPVKACQSASGMTWSTRDACRIRLMPDAQPIGSPRAACSVTGTLLGAGRCLSTPPPQPPSFRDLANPQPTPRYPTAPRKQSQFFPQETS